MRAPFSFVKGPGSLALVGSEPASGRPGPGLSAPSSSTPDANAAACAGVELGISVAAPATVSAVTASATVVERILKRPELVVTGALLPWLSEATASAGRPGTFGPRAHG